MSNTLNVTTTVTDQGTEIVASIDPSSDIPQNVFLYLNTGTTELGEYQGVAAFSQISRFQVWQGQVIPVFSNKYVRFNQAKIVVNGTTDPNTVISGLLASLTSLKNQYLSQRQTSTTYGF